MATISGRVESFITLGKSLGIVIRDSFGKSVRVILDGCEHVKENEWLILSGDYKEHVELGRYFKASKLLNLNFQVYDYLAKFLASGFVKGLGSSYAKKIVEYLKENSLDFETFFSESWKAIPGVPLNVTKRIKQALDNLTIQQRIILDLVKIGISLKSAEKLLALHGELAFDKVVSNPYEALRELDGFRFKKIDNVARLLNFDFNHPDRIKFAIEDILLEGLNDGHTCLPREFVINRCLELTGVASREKIEQCLTEMIQKGHLDQQNELVGFRKVINLEREAGQMVSLFILRKNDRQIDVSYSCNNGVRLSEEQEDAINMALESNFCIVSGGPGTGKTTLIKKLWDITQSSNRVFLASPTGKASQRLSSLCDTEAYTLHRLLKYDPKSGYQRYSADNPLPADLLIIDESSMLDVEIFWRLLKSVSLESKIVLVGDKDQLPPVSPGNVFSDLLLVQTVPRVILSKIFRRTEGSDINFLARKILDGEPKSVINLLRQSQELILKIHSEQEEAVQNLIDVVRTTVSKSDPKLTNTLILTPANKGVLGAENLNRKIFSAIFGESKLKLNAGDELFEVGVKVIQKQNNYDVNGTAVFNGDVGFVVESDRKQRSLIVQFWDGRIVIYNRSHIDQLGLAYCLTVHKAQGQEADTVIFIMDKSHYVLLNKNLFYTAVTRAKKRLILLSNHKTIWTATLKTNTVARNSLLSNFLVQYLNQNKLN
ncbi:MAG: AAA family ATPase [Deltaproteobacteria bacterium]|nr:AAA family ATPase [Deltaproteobacteria bacterium]